MLLQVVIILTLSFLNQRKHLCLSCCDGRPGVVMYAYFHYKCAILQIILLIIFPDPSPLDLVVYHFLYSPINFVDGNERRWVFACSFVLMSYQAVQLFGGQNFIHLPDQIRNNPTFKEQFGWVSSKCYSLFCCWCLC